MPSTPLSFLPARRRLLLRLALAPAAAWAAPSAPLVQVWKSPTCACCPDWSSHPRDHGGRLEEHTVSSTAEERHRLGEPAEYGSSHAGLVAADALDGHVPASDIQRMLRDRAAASGPAEPGMPL